MQRQRVKQFLIMNHTKFLDTEYYALRSLCIWSCYLLSAPRLREVALVLVTFQSVPVVTLAAVMSKVKAIPPSACLVNNGLWRG